MNEAFSQYASEIWLCKSTLPTPPCQMKTKEISKGHLHVEGESARANFFSMDETMWRLGGMCGPALAEVSRILIACIVCAFADLFSTMKYDPLL